MIKQKLREAWLKRKPFYRRYGYRSPLYIGSMNHRGIVDPDLKLFFNRVPKCGNSSIVKALGKHYGRSTEDVEGLKDTFLTPADLSRQQVDRFDEFYKIAIVRDPFVRTLSAYLDIFVGKGRAKDYGIGSFDEFCRYLDNGGLYDNIHWAPQIDCLLMQPDEFDHIARFERLSEEMAALGERIGIDLDPDRHRHSPHATNATDRVSQHYNAENEEIVARLMAKDFAAFDYKAKL